MGRGKRRFNKDSERSRQEKKQVKGKYGSPTTIHLREKLTGEDKKEEIKEDYDRLHKNHYNACYNDFAKRTLEKNHRGQEGRKFSKHLEELKIKEPNLYIFGKQLLQEILYLNDSLNACEQLSIVLLL